jgi:type IV pilus assembly protein PilC
MYTSGVPVLVALNVTTDALSDPGLHEAVAHLRDGVSRGRRLSEVMRSLSLFPPLVPRMVALGEESGRLDTMLQRAADLLDRDVDHAIKRLVTLAEPALTLVLGARSGVLKHSTCRSRLRDDYGSRTRAADHGKIAREPGSTEQNVDTFVEVLW